MPQHPRTHVAARKPASSFVHSKQKHVDDDDGWTHVVGGNRKVDAAVARNALSHLSVSFVYNSRAELKTSFERHRLNWTREPSCQKLVALVAAMQRSKAPITRIVCLGLGSLQATRSSHTQLAALLTLREALGDKSIECIAQEPAFSEIDKSFLADVGLQVVDDPSAFQLIDESTLVYAIHCYPSLYLEISKHTHPAALVCNDMEQISESRVLAELKDPDAKEQILAMAKRCDSHDFPDVRNIFSSTKIYWRIPADLPLTVH